MAWYNNSLEYLVQSIAKVPQGQSFTPLLLESEKRALKVWYFFGELCKFLGAVAGNFELNWNLYPLINSLTTVCTFVMFHLIVKVLLFLICCCGRALITFYFQFFLFKCSCIHNLFGKYLIIHYVIFDYSRKLNKNEFTFDFFFMINY